MILVIDANPFIAGFLRDSTARRIMLSEKISLYSPDWLISEFERNEDELIERFPQTADFFETKRILFKFVEIVPKSEYSSYIEEGSNLTKHTKDVPYFALALYLKCPIWSDEKSFKLQSKVKIFSTADLLKEMTL